MKHLVAITFVLATAWTACSFDSHSPTTDGGNDVDAALDIAADASTKVTLTETVSETASAGHATFCNSGAQLTRANSWFRAFRPTDFGIATTLHITRINFVAEDAIGGVPVTVRIHTYTGATGGSTLDASKFTQLASLTTTVADSTPPQDHHTDLTADIAPGTVFVVEISSIDTFAGANRLTGFHAGANTNGQIAPWYFESDACGISEPTSQAGAVLILTADGVF